MSDETPGARKLEALPLPGEAGHTREASSDAITEGTSVIIRKGPAVPLPRPPGRGGVTLEDRVTEAHVFSLRTDVMIRAGISLVVATVFLGLNYLVMSFLQQVFQSDLALLNRNPAAERVVNTQVLLALIGATVVQTGVAIATIIRYLFPKKPDNGTTI
jgi:hypothetical protein